LCQRSHLRWGCIADWLGCSMSATGRMSTVPRTCSRRQERDSMSESITVRSAVFRGDKGKQVSIESVRLDPPKAGEGASAGVGGVGMSVVSALKLAGANPIVAVDVNQSKFE